MKEEKGEKKTFFLLLEIVLLKDIFDYSFPRAAVTKYHKLNGLKQQEVILSQFWRIQVQNQGVGSGASGGLIAVVGVRWLAAA